MADELNVKGKNAIITGGNKNLGAATARELAKQGVNLFLHYHSASGKADADKLAEELASTYGVKVAVYGAPLNTADDLTKLFDAGEKAIGKFDYAVNNVGMVLKKPLTEISEKEFDTMDGINNKTAFFFLKEAGKRVADHGKIVSLVTSLLAAYCPGYSIYQGSKSPVEYYSKSLSHELKPRSISVNCVAPGPMDTPFLYGQETDADISYYKSVGIDGRLTKIEDIVPIIRFLLTEGGWISGQTIYASGGFTAH